MHVIFHLCLKFKKTIASAAVTFSVAEFQIENLLCIYFFIFLGKAKERSSERGKKIYKSELFEKRELELTLLLLLLTLPLTPDRL